jgi:hypothetical protein
MHRAEIEHGTLEEANTELASYGIAVTRLGNLDINLDDDDNARLKKLAGDTAYSRLAGSYQAAAQAQMMQGAGEGMAQGGAAVSRSSGRWARPRETWSTRGPPGYPPPPAPGFTCGGGQGYAPPGPDRAHRHGPTVRHGRMRQLPEPGP